MAMRIEELEPAELQRRAEALGAPGDSWAPGLASQAAP